MHNQWLIMLAGVGTVFITLILLAIILSFFPMIFGGRKEKKHPNPAPIPEMSGPSDRQPAQNQVSIAPVAAENDHSLIAVLTAAIAAASGTSASSFRIASIMPASRQEGSFNTPIWGRVERYTRE